MDLVKLLALLTKSSDESVKSLRCFGFDCIQLILQSDYFFLKGRVFRRQLFFSIQRSLEFIGKLFGLALKELVLGAQSVNVIISAFVEALGFIQILLEFL